MTWFVRDSAQIEMYMNSVERLEQYIALPQENPVKLINHLGNEGETYHDDSKSDDELVQLSPSIYHENSWPRTGSIEFKKVRLRYRDNLPLVLKNLSFSVRPSEKVLFFYSSSRG